MLRTPVNRWSSRSRLNYLLGHRCCPLDDSAGSVLNPSQRRGGAPWPSPAGCRGRSSGSQPDTPGVTTCWRDAAAIAANSSSKSPPKARPSQHRGGFSATCPAARRWAHLLRWSARILATRARRDREDIHDHHDNSEFANRADTPPDALDSRGRGDRRLALFAIVGVVAHGSTTTSSRRPTRRDPGLSARELGEER